MTDPLPIFNTERLLLRGVTEADIPAYTRHFVDYRVIRHLASTVPWPYPEHGVRDYVRDLVLPVQGKDHWLWGLFLKTSPDELIGAVELWRDGTPEHRGFWLGHRFWGRGLMTEAVAPVMDHAFDVLGFDVLVFSNARGNNRSRRIKEKTGARLLRIMSGEFVDPVYTHREIWELTAAEWRARRS